MIIYNTAYNLYRYINPHQPHINEDSDIKIEFAMHSTYNKISNWAKWAAAFPFNCLQSAYNTFSLLRHQDLLQVVLQTHKGNAVTPMRILFHSFHLISSPRLIQEVTSRHFRNDPNGLFEAPDSSDFLDLLQDLFPEYKKEISKEDFLFTCSRQNTKDLRRPFIEFFLKATARERIHSELIKVTQEVLDSIEQATANQISARKLSETLSVAVLSRLFLDQTHSLEECQEIGRAASIVINYGMMLSANSTQKKEYEWAKAKLKKAIQSSRGEFVDFLRDAQMSEVQIYGTLMLAYIAGSETTSTALHSILWRLGQHPEVQREIVNNETALDSFIRECLRVFTPVYLFTRIARKDLVITVKNRGDKEWQYHISKGDGIMCSPYLAGKDEYLFHSTNTSQNEQITRHKDRYPTKVFSGGPHSCPGMHLAEQEISSFVLALLKKYVITSTPNKPNLSAKGMFTLKLEEALLNLNNRC